MGNPRVRGLVYLGVGIVFAWLFCVLLPFTVLPAAGLSVALPVIQVPGESVHYGWWFWGGNLTNTMIGGVIAGLIVTLWVLLNYRSTNGWTRQIPDRAQAWTEVFMETFYDFCEGLGGENFRKAPLLWPLVAAIFVFLLAGNWMKLVPGVESIGYVHCAYEGQTGYQRINGAGDTWRLWVDRSLDSGTAQTAASEADCVHQLKVSGTYYGDYDPADYAEEREAFYARLAAIGADVPEGQASAVPVPSTELMSNAAVEEEPEEAAPAEDAEDDGLEADNLCLLPTATEDGEGTADGEATEEEAPTEGETEDAEPTEEAESQASQIVLTSTLGVEESDEEHTVETASAEEVAALYEELLTAEEAHANEEISDGALEEARCAATQAVYPNAIFPLSADELVDGNIQPYIFAITPFVRGVATDLSFNIGLALLAMIAVQIYGVMALGPAYFEKFVNLGALGKAGDNPIGAVDFIAGIIEILSEIGKVVSLAFRLFGNIFAGGIVLMVFPFLLAFVVPGIMIGLEIIIGFVQALVFAILTVVFAAQAMEAHHGDEHDDHGDEAAH